MHPVLGHVPSDAPPRSSEPRVDVDLAISLFGMNPDWFERYWYGDHPPSMWGNLVTTARSLCREVPRVGAAIARAVPIRDLSQRPHHPA